MRTFPRLLVVAVLFLCATSARAQASSGSAADEKDIRQIGGQFQDAWNKADSRMISDLFLSDGDYVSSTGRTARGRAEVQKAFSEQWVGIYKGTKIASNITNVRFVRKDVAVADGAFSISGMKDASGKGMGARDGLMTVVAAKKGDRWYVAALRGTVPSVPPGSPGK
jgi:uncharacterized protein (TIGR02246 family)